MSDCISRIKASDHLKNRLIQTAMNNTEEITSYDKVCEDIVDNRLDTWLNEVLSVDTCGDCISRKNAVEKLTKLADKTIPGAIKAHTIFIAQYLQDENDFPSVEPERKTGKWEKDRDFGYPLCSVCGITNMCESDFCPNCGADMRGKKF